MDAGDVDTGGFNRPVLLIDGVCNLCNSLARFVAVRNDEFLFASLQSDTGKGILHKHDLPTDEMETFVLVEDGECYTKSTAALLLFKRLGFPYSLLYPFILVPSFLRNPVYDLVATLRYRIFGKKDECEIPDTDYSDRFLDV